MASDDIWKDVGTSKVSSAVKKCDIFIGNLSLFTDGEKLLNFFAAFGEIRDVRIIIDPVTKRSRRFGFVTFSKEESVMKVLNRSEKLVLDGQELDVKPAFKRSNEEGGLPPVKRPKKSFIPKEIFNEMVPKPSAGKVFVGGLSSETNDDDLRQYFSKFGAIDKLCHVIDKQTNRSKGFCFVTFANPSSAQVACISRFHELKGRRVEVKLAAQEQKNPCLVQPAPQAQGLPPLYFWPGLGLGNMPYYSPLPVFSQPNNGRRLLQLPYSASSPLSVPLSHHQSFYPIHALIQAAQQSLLPSLDTTAFNPIIKAESIMYKYERK